MTTDVESIASLISALELSLERLVCLIIRSIEAATTPKSCSMSNGASKPEARNASAKHYYYICAV